MAIKRHSDDIRAKASRLVSADRDICYETKAVDETLAELLAMSSVRHKDDKEMAPYGSGRMSMTDFTAMMYVSFMVTAHDGPGGSRSDYCASAVMKALDGYTLRIVDLDAFARLLVPQIKATALYPDRELEALRKAGLIL